MKPRVELQTLLETILGSRNVYFQPPENIKLVYPCILYDRTGFNIDKASDKRYVIYGLYEVKLIDNDPDNEDKLLEILDIPMTKHKTRYKYNNLNHDVFDVYY